jgi:phosphoribosylglycinamide formyltransferase 1
MTPITIALIARERTASTTPPRHKTTPNSTQGHKKVDITVPPTASATARPLPVRPASVDEARGLRGVSVPFCGCEGGAYGSVTSTPFCACRGSLCPPGEDHYRVRVTVTRLVVLVSGVGSNLQALLDASQDPAFGARVVAVGADRDGIEGLRRARTAEIPTFVESPADYPDRAAWDAGLTLAVAQYLPDLVISAGFMKILGSTFLGRFPGACVNTHPALLPAFPGAHPVRDTLRYGVKVTGATVHIADEGVDSGPIVAQVAVPVSDDDDELTLHDRIKVAERGLLVNSVSRMARYGWTIEGRKVSIP